MPVRVIILCGGEGGRWKNHLGVDKHLVPIDDKPLLQRIVDDLRSADVSDIVIAGRGDQYRIAGTQLWHVPLETCTEPSEKFNSSRQMWLDAGQTVLMFGDVFFSASALQAVLEAPAATVNFVGRLTASRITGCPYPEIFALAFDHTAHGTLDEALGQIARAGNDRPTGWQLYDILADQAATCGFNACLRLKFTHIDDLTEDFDFPKDHSTWLIHRAAGQVAPASQAGPGRMVPTVDKRKWQIRAQLAFCVGIALGITLTTILAS